MEQAIAIMLPPLVACLILTGIHTYLGLHVVSRGVIFVDLALAQVAALGSTFAFLLGFDPQSYAGYFYSLGFAFLGAAIFSLSRLKDKHIPQEAIIGVVFAVASSAAILIADRAPQGAEHVEAMLTGSILWVSWPTIWKTLIIYVVVGVFHYIFRDKFLLISMRPEEAERRKLRVRWWDFLFYMSFGFVITSSVAIAGVLLVFSFLIVPSLIGMLYSTNIGARLVIGWISGTLVSFVGLFLSYRMDFPSGPSVVCTFGVFLILAGLLRYLLSAERKLVALARVASGTAVVAALLLVAVQFRPVSVGAGADRDLALQRVTAALDDLASPEKPHEEAIRVLREEKARLLNAIDQGRIEMNQAVVQALGQLQDPDMVPVLERVFSRAQDPWMRFYASLSLVRLGEKNGLHNLIVLLKEDAPAFLKSRVLAELQPLMGDIHGFDPSKEDHGNEQALNRIEVWWHQNVDRIRWDEQTRTFQLD
ncbi:MAG TPA: iron chelate uptake ABC transporter family permease subunit [Acidobacteriota bacterium]|nr:iron chelate uptake ABC transporter family permease subunit [Acidobacteriota bacterium]